MALAAAIAAGRLIVYVPAAVGAAETPGEEDSLVTLISELLQAIYLALEVSADFRAHRFLYILRTSAFSRSLPRMIWKSIGLHASSSWQAQSAICSCNSSTGPLLATEIVPHLHEDDPEIISTGAFAPPTVT